MIVVIVVMQLVIFDLVLGSKVTNCIYVIRLVCEPVKPIPCTQGCKVSGNECYGVSNLLTFVPSSYYVYSCILKTWSTGLCTEKYTVLIVMYS